MKKLSSICLLCILLAFVFYPGSGAQPTTSIKLGFFGPQSGVLAPFGNQAIKGVQLARDEINRAGGIRGKKLEVIPYDTALGPAASAKYASEAIEKDKVSALIGDLSYLNTIALLDVSKKKKIPLISYGATELMAYKYDNPYFFKISPGTSNYLSAIVGYGSKIKKVKKLGVFTGERPTEKLYSTILKDYLKRSNLGTIVDEKYFPIKTTDFTKLIKEIMDKKPDALFLIAPSEEAGLIVKQARKSKIDIPIFTAARFIKSKKFIRIAGEYATGVFMSNAYYPKIIKNKGAITFVNKWSKTYVDLPVALSAAGYDSAKILAFVMTKYGTNPDEIKKGLKELRKYDGASGILHFLPPGSIIKDMVISEWKNGKLVPLQLYKHSKDEIEFVLCQETKGVIEKD